MKAETAIAFELRFAEELIERRLMRKGLVGCRISQNVFRFIAVDRGLDVNKRAFVME